METMTPFNPATDGQLGKLSEKLTARLKKNKSELPSDVFQEIILTDDTLIDEMYDSIRKRIEARSCLVFRTVKVDRTRSAKEALKATGRSQHLNDSVVSNMPKAESDEVELVLFKIGREVTDEELDKEHELRGTKPADPYSLSAINEADPAFADKCPNGTHWKDNNGKWCCVIFGRGGVERYVDVRRCGVRWVDVWYFAGVRKSSSSSNTLDS